MKTKLILSLALVAGLLPATLRAEATNAWTCDVTIYGFAAGMSGDMVVRGVPADVDLGFDEILEDLEFGAMGSVRVGYGRWALTTDVLFMGLGASKNDVSVDFDQWMVEPSLSYLVCRNFEVLAGARYNQLDGEISGPLGVTPSGTQSWWDPIVGGNIGQPLGEKFSLNLRGDIGGFGVGSDLTWQVLPSVNWHVSRRCSVMLGYRWFYADYTTGSGADEFQYDILNQGAQLGLTIHF